MSHNPYPTLPPSAEDNEPLPLTMASLFAGVGGFDLAGEQTGWDTLWMSEYDKAASQVLAHRFPGVPNYGDIHDICGRQDHLADLEGGDVLLAEAEGLRRYQNGLGATTDGRPTHGETGASPTNYPWATLHPTHPDCERKYHARRVTLLTGGFPCQDYSMAGLRSGLAGDRGALWWEYLRLITELRPEYVFGENVPGLLSSDNGRDFRTIVGSLLEVGYRVAWRVYDSQFFGVAQRRRRLFIVATRDPRPARGHEILALSAGVSGHPQPSRPARQGASSTLAGGPREGRSTDDRGGEGGEYPRAGGVARGEGQPPGGGDGRRVHGGVDLTGVPDTSPTLTHKYADASGQDMQPGKIKSSRRRTLTRP